MEYIPPKNKLSILLGALKGRRAIYVVALCAVIVTNLADFVAPQVVRIVVDSVIGNEPFSPWVLPFVTQIGGRGALRSHMWLCGLFVLGAALVSALFGVMRRYWALEPAEHMAQTLRNRLYGHIQQLPFNWHVKVQTGDIIQRCTSDVDVVRNTVSNVVPDFARSIVMILASAVIMIIMDGTMAIAGLCLIPFFAVTGFIYHRIIGKTFLAKDESEGGLQAVVQENLSGVRVVRAFGREQFEIDRFKNGNDDFFKKSLKMGNSLAAFWALSDILALGQLLIVVIVGALRCLNGQLTIGTFLIFFTYTEMLVWPARETGRQLSELAKCSISLGRLQDVLQQFPEADMPNAITPPMDTDIVFDHVTFAYDNQQPVLKDISFVLRKGETLGVLGGTGSGKSTLAYLLTKLYDLPPENGTITIGGVDIRNVSRKYIRTHVAMVLQEPFLYSKTVGENIKGATNASGDKMEHAATIAAIHDTLTDLEQGYDTKVGERGVTLSGGQKQRVAIARMLLQDAPIMIFDDSLSAVDTQTDAQIRRALRTNTNDATVILISHRINTLMHADKILVLSHGAMEALGTHEELLQSENTYRRVYELQRAAGTAPNASVSSAKKL